ncbi:MAG: tRNA 2-selenouridine(34) synthase MnmH [Bacteroidales bacterium]|nr:tRNA 2-selenouridine(34) synthase MnmH [Bacteroidales bacterium]
MEYLDAASFLRKSEFYPILDVRSPGEFLIGHIPGAINLPLFTNEERKEIGILYKNSGKEASVLKGLDIVGPKMSAYVKKVRSLVVGKQVLVHCWRGGMRSASMAWLLETAGFEAHVLEGGYKAFRKFIRSEFERNYNLVVLGGKTGSGKSEILNSIRKIGEQVIDLEKMANHKGSAFGAFGQGQQPTSEHFENMLYEEFKRLDKSRYIWVEDESRSIGTVSLPEPFFNNIRSSPLIFIDVPKEVRIERLVKDYAGFDKNRLKDATLRIQQKLGGLNTKLTIEAIEQDDFRTASSILLSYYDKAYIKGLSYRNSEQIHTVSLGKSDPSENAKTVVAFFQSSVAKSLISAKLPTHE